MNAAAEAGSEQCDGATNLYTEGARNPEVQGQEVGGLGIVYDLGGTGN